MKVKFEKDYRRWYTLEDVERAKMVIQYERDDDDSTVKDWAMYAAQEILNGHGHPVEVLKAEAETAVNRRVWNAYGEGTGDMDVYITATVALDDGFLALGAYLSDVWGTGAIDYRHHTRFTYYCPADLQ